MKIEKIFMETADGVQLSGLLHSPEETTKEVIVAVHGMSSNCLGYRDQVIAKEATQQNIAFLNFNNRGNGLMNYMEKKENGKVKRLLGGTSYEDPLEGYEDIKSATYKMLELGYTKIHLQGHSLGSTKVVYAYHKSKKQKEEIAETISSVILLSLINIPRMEELMLGSEKFKKMIEYAVTKQKAGMEKELMPEGIFLHPISVKTFLRYFKENKEINFARYHDPEYFFPELNTISCSLFMRWGTVNEMIETTPEELASLIQSKIKGAKATDISYIEGANHSYRGKEEELAKQIVKFIKEN